MLLDTPSEPVHDHVGCMHRSVLVQWCRGCGAVWMIAVRDGELRWVFAGVVVEDGKEPW